MNRSKHLSNCGDNEASSLRNAWPGAVYQTDNGLSVKSSR